MKRKNVTMAWIDDKTYDMVPKSWIIEYLKIWELSDYVIKFITEAMKNWRGQQRWTSREGDAFRYYYENYATEEEINWGQRIYKITRKD